MGNQVISNIYAGISEEHSHEELSCSRYCFMVSNRNTSSSIQNLLWNSDIIADCAMFKSREIGEEKLTYVNGLEELEKIIISDVIFVAELDSSLLLVRKLEFQVEFIGVS